MPYTIQTVYLNHSKPGLKVQAALGSLGEAWVYPELPAPFYDAIMQLAEAAVKAREAEMKMVLLAEKAGEE
jgi:hypothetical protein